MIETHLRLDTASIHRSNAGLVICGVWLVVGTAEFPSAGWNDFAVVMLSSWASQIARLLSGEAMKTEIRFMEGPFLVELERTGTSWSLRLVESGIARHMKGAFSIPIVPLAQSVMEAANSLLAVCRKREWWSAETDALDAAGARLSAELTRATN